MRASLFSHARLVAVLALLVAAPMLVACAGVGTAEGDRGSLPSRSATPLCPLGVEASPPAVDCIVVDTEANQALNNAYGERNQISADVKAEIDLLIAPVTAALTPLVDGVIPVTTVTVTEALASAGIESPQLKGETEYIGFAHSAGGGCLFGAVKAGLLTVESGGFIADGGCMTAPGH